MESLKRVYSVANLNLNRHSGTMTGLMSPTINFQSLAEAEECCLVDLREAKKKFNEISDQILENLDESHKDYTTTIASYLNDSQQFDKILYNSQTKISNFRKQLSADTTADLLLNNTLNQSFHMPNSA